MGVDPRSNRESVGLKAWSDHVASLAADALVDARLIDRANFEDARRVIAEEIFVRLCLRDFPPGNDEVS
jgi:hypothetical protein